MVKFQLIGPGEYLTLIVSSLVMMIVMVIAFMSLELYYTSKGRLIHTYKLV